MSVLRNDQLIGGRHCCFARTNLTAGLYILRNQLLTSVQNATENQPADFMLEQNHPNPFNPVTSISYTLQKSALTKLSVYNVNGELVTTLVDEFQQPGNYTLRWHAGASSSGVYLLRLESGGACLMKKMMMVK